MISRKQLAEHWQITPQAVSQHKKRGCPMTSLEAADEWRKLHCKIAAPGAKAKPPVPVLLSPDTADEVGSLIDEGGTLHRPTLEANLRTLNELTAQAKAAVAHALEHGENEVARRWSLTLLNIIGRSAITAKSLQDLLERDRVTMRLEDVREIYLGSLAEMRRLVESAVESLPPLCNASDPTHAYGVFSDWFNNSFLKSMARHADARGSAPEPVTT
jgi:hypothetical protein